MQEVESSQDPELGLLSRVRSWTDLVPAKVLLVCLRPATSLTLLTVGCVAFWIAHWGDQVLLGSSLEYDRLSSVFFEEETSEKILPGHKHLWPYKVFSDFNGFSTSAHYFTNPTAAILLVPTTGPDQQLPSVGQRILSQCWHLLVWAIPVGLVLRESVCQIASRPRTGYFPNLYLAFRRLMALLLVTLIPLLIVGMAGVFYWILGWIGSFQPLGNWLAEGIFVLAIPVILFVGVLVFGSLFAIPFSWAAVMTEAKADSFDALSRGYEYTFRRPFHLVSYLAIAWCISWLGCGFANGICGAALVVLQHVADLGIHASEQTTGFTVAKQIVQQIPTVFSLLLFWSLVGGIYLLMRQATNSQEIEDIWEPTIPLSK